MKFKLQQLFKINANNKHVKFIEMHKIKPWLIYVTKHNIILWNIFTKTCLKAFTIQSLDSQSSRQSQIRDIIFYDRQSLKFELNKDVSANSIKNNWIVIVSQNKISLFDYYTQYTKTIYEKNVRTIRIMDQGLLVSGYHDGVFKILNLNDKSILKTFKGYHSKAIISIFVMQYSEQQNLRLIIDNLIACWNKDGNNDSPEYKFITKNRQKGKILSEQLISVRYDKQNYRLISLSQEYIIFWYTLTGNQLKKINHKNLINIELFPLVDLMKGCILGLSQTGIFLKLCAIDKKNKKQKSNKMKLNQKEYLIYNTAKNSKLIDFKFNIYNYKLTILTSEQIICMQIVNRNQNIVFNFKQITNLTNNTINQLYNQVGQLRDAPKTFKFSNCQKVKEKTCYYYLIFMDNCYSINLINQEPLSKVIKQIQGINDSLTFNVSVSLDNSFYLYQDFSNQIIYFLNPNHKQLKISNIQNYNLQIFSAYRGISGAFIQIQMFAVLAFTKQEKPITQIQKPQSKQIYLFLFKYATKQILFKKPCNGIRLFSGSILSIQSPFDQQILSKKQIQTQSLRKLGLTKLQFFSLKLKIQDVFVCPQKVGWSNYGNICIFIYKQFSIIFKITSKNLLQKRGKINYKVNVVKQVKSYYFWQNLLFLVTQTDIHFICLALNQIIDIKISSISDNQLRKANYLNIYSNLEKIIDNIQGELSKMPLDQFKILFINQMNLIIVNKYGKWSKIPIINKFVQFCMLVEQGQVSNGVQIAYNFHKKLYYLVNMVLLEKQYIEFSKSFRKQSTQQQIISQIIADKIRPSIFDLI